MNDLTIPQQSLSSASKQHSLSTELAKMLGLVAPISMSADQQTLWLASAVDSLEDIRANEVAAVSAEVRRIVTRPSQIVPEIARLVGERRKRPPSSGVDKACSCGRGKQIGDRDGVHWIMNHGRWDIEWCDRDAA